MRKLSQFSWHRWPLAVKLTVTITTLIVTVVMTVTLLAIRREQQTFRAELQQQADLLLATLAAAAVDPLYTLDADALSDMVEGLGAQALEADEQILASGRIYDPKGRIIGDAYDPLLQYSLEIDPFGQRVLASDTTVYDWRSDQLVAGRAVILGHQRLGAVSVGLPIARLEAKLTTVRNQGLEVALATIILGTLVAILLGRSITSPLQGLVQATEYIAHGDLTHEITIGGGPEIVVLGTALEHMRVELRQLYQGLEQQVADRTQALRESETRFRQVVTSISDHVYMTEITPEGNQINRYLSPNIEALTGYPLEKFLADWSFWPSTVIHPDDREAAAAQAARLTNGQNSEMEYRLVRADGNTIWVRDSGRVEPDPTRQSLLVYGVVGDITRRMQVEEELAQARDQAQEANRLKTQLLANISHDLRTPLNAIIGYTEMLQEGVFGPLSDQQYQATKEIIDSTGQLLSFVSNLLNQAQIDSGKVILKPTSFVPSDLVIAIRSTVEIQAKVKGLELICNVAPDVPAILAGDPYWLRQILANLVNNAIKFTEEGSVHIQVYQPDPTHWAMQVSDTGPGIPPEIQPYIFDSFHQGSNNNLKQHLTGAGLGLSIVNHLTILMGGQLTLESEVGRGSIFTIILPLQPI